MSDHWEWVGCPPLNDPTMVLQSVATTPQELGNVAYVAFPYKPVILRLFVSNFPHFFISSPHLITLPLS